MQPAGEGGLIWIKTAVERVGLKPPPLTAGSQSRLGLEQHPGCLKKKTPALKGEPCVVCPPVNGIFTD